MDNSNIIISIIIVLCIAAGVTAYGISEGDNAVFNDLTGFTPDSSDSQSSNGIGDLIGNDSNQGTGSGVSTGASTTPSGSGSSSGSSSGNAGGSNGGSSSGSNGGSSSNGGESSGGDGSGQSTTVSKISAGEAQSIAAQYIGEEGAYVSSVKDDGSEYICYISNSNGTVVDAIGISYSGENLGKI